MNPQDYLHLYIGCFVKATIRGDLQNEKSKEVIAKLMAVGQTVGPVKYVTIYVIDGDAWESIANPHPKDCQPILRPLSSMTEEEETEYTALVDQWNFGFRRNMRGAASSTHYLLSKHFDVFGLIEAGLAIDSTQVNKTENC